MPATVAGQLRLMFHRMTFLAFAFAIYYDKNYTVAPPQTPEHMARDSIAGRWKYLTYQNVAIHCLYFCLAMFNDISGTNEVLTEKKSKFQKLRDFLFTTLVFPLGIFVGCMFWGLYSIDRDLIYPVRMDVWFPSWLNHVMHTLPVVAVFIELVITHHDCPKGIKKFIPVLTYFAGYLAWTLYLANVHNHWIYPVFEVLDEAQRIAFFAFLAVPPTLFVFVGQCLHKQIWGESISEVTQKMKSKKKN